MAKITLKEPSWYWIKRMAREGDELVQMSIEEADMQLAKYYLELSDKVLDKIEKYYLLIQADKEGDAIVTHTLNYGKYVDLFNEITVELNKLGVKETGYLERKFMDLYKTNSRMIEEYFAKNGGRAFKMNLDDGVVRQAVNRIWCQDNKAWYQRVGINNDALKSKLQSTVGDAVAAGMPVDDLSTALKNDLNMSFHEAQRLARTELAHTYNQSSIDRYKDADVKFYQWISGDDKSYTVNMTEKQIDKASLWLRNKLRESRDRSKGEKYGRTVSIKVCELCEEMNGQIFPIEDDIHIPPDYSHPNCRCGIIPVIDKG